MQKLLTTFQTVTNESTGRLILDYFLSGAGLHLFIRCVTVCMLML